MEKELAERMQTLLYRSGYKLVKLPNLQKRLKKLETRTLRPKERGLNELAVDLKRQDNHKDYNALIKQFIPEWDSSSIDEAKFIGKGYSLSGFNAYRKVRINNRVFFEKVYFNSFIDFSKIEWFQEHVYDLVNQKINVPSVHKIYKGKILSLVYFEFLDLKPIKKTKEKIQTHIELTRTLYRLSAENQSYFSTMTIPLYIKNYHHHFQYHSYAHRAEQYLKGINVEAVEKQIDSFPKVITHSDIYPGNVFKNNALIDWDSYGYYPIGFDVAFTYCRLYFENQNHRKDNSLKWLDKHYHDLFAPPEWGQFKLSFTYFLLIFSMEYVENQEFYITDSLIENFKNASSTLGLNT